MSKAARSSLVKFVGTAMLAVAKGQRKIFGRKLLVANWRDRTMVDITSRRCAYLIAHRWTQNSSKYMECYISTRVLYALAYRKISVRYSWIWPSLSSLRSGYDQRPLCSFAWHGDHSDSWIFPKEQFSTTKFRALSMSDFRLESSGQKNLSSIVDSP